MKLRHLFLSYLLSLCAAAPAALADDNQQSRDVYLLQHRAYEECQAKHYQQALDLYEQAKALKPDDAIIRIGLGDCLVNLGRSPEAIPECYEAIKLDPTKEWGWVNLTAAYVNSGRLQDSVATGEEFLRRFPQSEHADEIRQMTVNAKRELSKRTQAMAPTTVDSYLPLAVENGAWRWPLNAMPIKVWIGEGRGVDSWQPEDIQLAQQAFQRWSDVTGNHITFQYVRSKRGADITVEWANSVSDQNTKESGVAHVMHHNETHEIFNGQIILTVKSSLDSTVFSPEQIRSVALHEIGHSLGLVGHSDNPNDIMFYSTAPGRDVSTRDIHTLHQLYTGTIADVMRTATTGGGTLPVAVQRPAVPSDFVGAVQRTARGQQQQYIPPPQQQYVPPPQPWFRRQQ